MSEQDYEMREYRRIDRVNKFLEYEYDCESAGGLVRIQRWGGGPPRREYPAKGDYYWCARSVPG